MREPCEHNPEDFVGIRRNCTASTNHSRGVYVADAEDILVEDDRLSDLEDSARATDDYWWQM